MHVNELKYQALFDLVGKPLTLNELEYTVLKESGHTGTLNEMWFQEFLTTASTKPEFPWSQNAWLYLGDKGATAPTLSERWYEYWSGGGGVTPPYQATIGGNGSDFGTGTQFNAPVGLPVPGDFMGLTIAYLGSFGQAYWNARFGAAGDEQLPGVDLLRVKLGDATAIDLPWNSVNKRYEGSAGEDLWAVIGADVGNVVGMWLADVPVDWINLLNPSENFADPAYGKSGVTIESGSTTPPPVAVTADTLTGTATSQAGLTQSLVLAAGARYSISIYAKQGTSQYLGINPAAAAFGSGSWAIFDLANGVVEATGGGGTTPITSMTDEGNGWWRCNWSAIAQEKADTLIPYAPSSKSSPLVLSGAQIFVSAAQLNTGLLQPYQPRGVGGGQINMPDLLMTVGQNGGGTRHGYRRGMYGTAVPDLMVDGNELREVRLRISNGNFSFKVEGLYPQDEFISMEVIGTGGVLLTADATHSQMGGNTTWKWNGTTIDLVVGNDYAIDFL